MGSAMERLGDTLNRMRIREALAHMPLDPSAPPETAPVCGRCRGAGFLRSDVPVGHADFGKLVPCRCRDDVGGLRLRCYRQ